MYSDIAELFTDLNIVEPLMERYKDYSFILNILNMSFYDGYGMYMRCTERMRAEVDKDTKDKIWDLYLIEIQNGYTGDFDEYYKSKIRKSEQNNLSKEEKKSEEERIIENTNKLEDNKFKKRAIK